MLWCCACAARLAPALARQCGIPAAGLQAAGSSFLKGMSDAAPASHPSFLIVVDTWISTKQAAPVHDNCNSRLLAVCSPESLCGRTVGAACMRDIPVRGGTLASLVQDVSMCAGTDSSFPANACC